MDIWQLETSVKVRHFLWGVCTVSASNPKIVIYALYMCPVVRDLWWACDCEVLALFREEDDFKDILTFWKEVNEKI